VTGLLQSYGSAVKERPFLLLCLLLCTGPLHYWPAVNSGSCLSSTISIMSSVIFVLQTPVGPCSACRQPRVLPLEQLLSNVYLHPWLEC
jgi:hypothetical protein